MFHVTDSSFLLGSVSWCHTQENFHVHYVKSALKMVKYHSNLGSTPNLECFSNKTMISIVCSYVTCKVVPKCCVTLFFTIVEVKLSLFVTNIVTGRLKPCINMVCDRLPLTFDWLNDQAYGTKFGLLRFFIIIIHIRFPFLVSVCTHIIGSGRAKPN